MNKKVAATAIFASAILSIPAMEADSVDLTDAKAKISYAIGVDIARSLTNQDLGVDPKIVAAGLVDAYGGKSAMTAENCQKVLMDFQKTLSEKMQAKQAAAGDENKKAGAAFLEANAKKEGVKTTASGLQYQVIKSGSGKTPAKSDTVRVHYHGTLIDGTVFDSSVVRNEPAEFGVDQVIPGWTEALQLMKEGDKWRLVIPSDLAYGARGAGGKIGPNSVLIFEVELLAVKGAGK
jgi:FKBP-type peptidyl-prolyl cis-trans isomerase FklB